MTDASSDDLRTIQHQAAEWLARHQSGRWTPDDQHDLEHWLGVDRRHRHSYEQLSRLWGDLDEAAASVQKLRHAALRYRPSTLPLHRRVAGPLATAASLLFAVVAIHWYWIGSETAYSTAKGERRNISLADGSTMLLNTDSQASVRYAGGRRVITLQRGEALFTVVHDAVRPFRVLAGPAQILDIGTRFNVYLSHDRVSVDVLEGQVEVQSAIANTDRLLSMGEAVAYDRNGHLLPTGPIAPEDRAAWQFGTLVFRDTPLSEVANQLTRYHPVDFDLTDRKLDGIKVSGSFRADNLSVLLKTLQASFPVLVTQLDPTHYRVELKAKY